MTNARAAARDGTRPRRRILGLEQIVDAAGHVFAEKGISNTALNDVAEHLGVSRAALYYHVDSREHLLRLVVDGYITLHREWLHAIRERADWTPEERLREAIRILMRGFSTHPHLSKIFLTGEMEMPDDVRDEQRRSRRVIQEEMSKIIVDGIEAGHFSAVDPKIVSYGIFGMINWLHVWFRTDGRYSTDDVAEMFANMIVGGIGLDGIPMAQTPLEAARKIQSIAALLTDQLTNETVRTATPNQRKRRHDASE